MNNCSQLINLLLLVTRCISTRVKYKFENIINVQCYITIIRQYCAVWRLNSLKQTLNIIAILKVHKKPIDALEISIIRL